MIETEQASKPVDGPTVDSVLTAARDRTLRLLARVSRRQGEGYEMPSFAIARTLYGPGVINMETWSVIYGGRNFRNNRDESDIVHYAGRGYADPVTMIMLWDECPQPGTVSRETVPEPAAPAVPVLVGADTRGGALSGCTCGDCTEIRARFDNAPTRTCECSECDDTQCQGECDNCESHGCEQCYGADYQCDDHECDDCYSGHSTCDGCGYCSECDRHQGDRDEDEICPNCSYCHQCEHVCDHH